MKKILLLILSLTLFVNAYSQKVYKYCELVGYTKFLSNKVIVAVDSGQGVNFDMINDTDNTDAANASANDDDDFPPVVATKNEKFYVKTSEKTYEGKTVQTDAKGSYIWKKVEIVAPKTEKKVQDKVKVKVKVQTFPSMIEAMNFMSKNGWEFVQAYVTTSGNENVYKWILKKAK